MNHLAQLDIRDKIAAGGWSDFRDLSHAFLGGGRYTEQRIAGMFRAYYDAGTTDSTLLVVAGYLAHVDEWLSFEQDWRALLAQKDLPYFDAAQFADREGQYATWTETERDEFMRLLIAVIQERARIRLAWGIEVDPKTRDLSRAYLMCALACITTVSSWAKYCDHSARIAHVFDSDPQWPDFRRAFLLADLDASKITMPILQPKQRLPQLQAAAILAQQVHPALGPYREEILRTRGENTKLDRRLLEEFAEGPITIAGLRQSALWPVTDVPEPTMTVQLTGAKRYTMRLHRIDSIFTEPGKEPRVIEPGGAVI